MQTSDYSTTVEIELPCSGGDAGPVPQEMYARMGMIRRVNHLEVAAGLHPIPKIKTLKDYFSEDADRLKDKINRAMR